MPITRTPMVDDDGTGTTGTIINNSWKTELYGQIDAALAAVGVWTLIETTLDSTDYPNFNPGAGIVGNTILYLKRSAGAPVSTIYGFQPAAPAFLGQRIVVHSIGAGDGSQVLNFYHEHGSAAANCKLLLRKSPTITINGQWAWAEFQYGVLGGVGAWVLGGYGSGIGGTLLAGDAGDARELAPV